MARSSSTPTMSSSFYTLLLLTTLSLVSALPTPTAPLTTPDGNPGNILDGTDTQSQSTSTSSSSKQYSSKGQAAAGIIGAILLLSVIGGGFYYFHRRTRPNRNSGGQGGNGGDGKGEQDGKRRWPMPRLGKVMVKENGKGEEWKKGKWEELN
jgi:hypothetical protein